MCTKIKKTPNAGAARRNLNNRNSQKRNSLQCRKRPMNSCRYLCMPNKEYKMAWWCLYMKSDSSDSICCPQWSAEQQRLRHGHVRTFLHSGYVLPVKNGISQFLYPSNKQYKQNLTNLKRCNNSWAARLAQFKILALSKILYYFTSTTDSNCILCIIKSCASLIYLARY